MVMYLCKSIYRTLPYPTKPHLPLKAPHFPYRSLPSSHKAPAFPYRILNPPTKNQLSPIWPHHPPTKPHLPLPNPTFPYQILPSPTKPYLHSTEPFLHPTEPYLRSGRFSWSKEPEEPHGNQGDTCCHGDVQRRPVSCEQGPASCSQKAARWE